MLYRLLLTPPARLSPKCRCRVGSGSACSLLTAQYGLRGRELQGRNRLAFPSYHHRRPLPWSAAVALARRRPATDDPQNPGAFDGHAYGCPGRCAPRHEREEIGLIAVDDTPFGLRPGATGAELHARGLRQIERRCVRDALFAAGNRPPTPFFAGGLFCVLTMLGPRGLVKRERRRGRLTE